LSWAELRVGVLVIFSFGLLATAIFFVGGETGFFTPTYPVTVYFPTANGMNSGTDVLMDGVRVGSVADIRITNDVDPERAVAVDLNIDERYPIRSDAIVTIGSTGLLGDATIEIARAGSDGDVIPPGGEILGSSGGDIRAIIAGTNDVIANLEVLSEQVQVIAGRIERGEGTLGRFLTDDSIFENVNAVTEEANLLVRDARTGDGTVGRFLSDDELFERAVGIVDNAEDIVTTVEDMVNRVDQGQGTVGRLINDPALYDRMENLVAQMEGIFEGIENGEGTLGQILTDESLFNNMNDAVEGVSVMVSNISDSEGTAGKLINDPTLYDNFNQTVSEVMKLMYDFRQDPGRFLTINFRLF
jgi:phospholipid/cholesterol/gamma-HCH transport system substrate-binding protein